MVPESLGLRVLGIGRNEYLTLISELKTNSTKLFRKPNPMNFLPKFPVQINIEPWWKVEIGYVLESDVKVCSNFELKKCSVNFSMRIFFRWSFLQ